MYRSPIASNPVWTPLDAGGSSSSGSARLTADFATPNRPGDLRQCIAISGLTAGRTYRWGGKVRIPSGQNRTGVGYMYLVWVSTVNGFDDCSGHVRVDFGGSTTTVGSWISIDAGTVTSPQGAIGAQISFNIQKTEAGGTFSINVDDAYLIETNVTTSIAINGPASGEANRPLSFEATASGCTPSRSGWSWTASGGASISGGTTSAVSVTWPSAGARTLTATNSACSGANGSRSVTINASPPQISVTAFPAGLVQDVGAGGHHPDR